MDIAEFVNLPAREIAARSEVIETTLSKYFNGHRDPNFSSLEKLAKKLNMKPEDVLVGIRQRREKREKMSDLTNKNLVA